jgi:hypothetical protein
MKNVSLSEKTLPPPYNLVEKRSSKTQTIALILLVLIVVLFGYRQVQVHDFSRQVVYVSIEHSVNDVYEYESQQEGQMFVTPVRRKDLPSEIVKRIKAMRGITSTRD